MYKCYMLPVAVALSSSDDSGIRYCGCRHVFTVDQWAKISMTLRFVQFARWQHPGEV